MPKIARTPGGPRGPVPKRADERLGHGRSRDAEIATAPATVPSAIPEAHADWHPVIQAWFHALATSGQSIFYQDSDWRLAEWAAERESRNLLSSRPSAQASALFLSVQSDLLVSEGARRRVRVELRREPQELASVRALQRYRVVVGGSTHEAQ